MLMHENELSERSELAAITEKIVKIEPQFDNVEENFPHFHVAADVITVCECENWISAVL